MSLVDKTLAQLERNRIHELTDLAMNIQASGKLDVRILIMGAHTGSSVNVEVRQKPGDEVIGWHGAKTCAHDSIEQLKATLAWLRQYDRSQS